MSKKALIACMAVLAVYTQAAQAITFTSAQFDVAAIATTIDGPAGFDVQAGPSVFASTSSVGATDIASAGGIGGPGIMTSSADVSGASGIASATATTHFVGAFLNTGSLLSLVIDYTPFSFAAGSGLASTSLFVQLTSNGVTLFQDYIVGARTFSYASTAGTTGLLDLTLTSDVSAGFRAPGSGDASSAGQATFLSPIPEPATWLLFTAGLGGLLVVVRPGARRARHPA